MHPFVLITQRRLLHLHFSIPSQEEVFELAQDPNEDFMQDHSEEQWLVFWFIWSANALADQH